MIETIAQAAAVAGPAPEGIWSPSNRPLTIGLTLTVVGAAFEALAVATTLPATIKDLGGLSLYGWAFSAFMLTNLVGITVSGSEADRQGPARPFVAGVLLFTLGLLIAGLAPSMLVVILGRAVQGFGGGVISSVAYASIGRAYVESAKPRMLAVLSTAWVVPGLIGPALAGLIADHVGWRWVFLGLIPFPLIALSMALPAMLRLGRDVDGPRDWGPAIASVRLAIGAGLLVVGLGNRSPLLAVGLVGAGALLAVPALRQLWPAGTLRAAPGLPATIATAGLLNLAFFGADAFIPLALTSVRGQVATVAGLALTAATITWTSGAWVQAHLAARWDRRRLVIAGLALIVVGIVGSAAVLSPALPVLLAPLAWGVAGLGMGFAYSTISLVVLENASHGQEGTAAAAMQLANILGSALGTGLGGVLIASAGEVGLHLALAGQDLLMVGVAGLAVVTALRLPGKPRLQTAFPAAPADGSAGDALGM
jgi:MFS family permease